MTFVKRSIIVQVRPLLIGLPIVLAATGLSAAPAFAQDDGTAPATPAGPADPAADRTSVTVGVGGVYMPDYEGSNFVLAMAAMPATAQTSPTPPPSLPAAPPVPTAPQFAPIPAPDYTTDAAWLCRPGRQDACAVDQDVTVIAANGKRKIARFQAEKAPAFDCFYVYPTVSLDPTPNSDLDIGPEEKAVAASQAARFAQHCRVFAPMYRQATLTALRAAMTGQPTTADRNLAYLDVQAAWHEYLARDNAGRGVVLIGHSQGARILKRLLAEVIEKDAAMKRKLVAAYLIGTNVAVPPGADVGGDFKTIKLCRSADDYGCVVTYVSFRADSPPPTDARFGHVEMPGMVAACTNPAALGGGRATADAILSAKGAMLSLEQQGPWTKDGAPVTTPFVSVPGMISTECVSSGGAGYLAVSVNAAPSDARTDTLTGDQVVNGQVLKEWGLHLIDMPVVMGDLVDLSDAQAGAWRGVPRKSKRK
jgi:hypothetical protein